LPLGLCCWRFVREVFDRIEVRDDQIVPLTPKPLFAPLFALHRRERFEGDSGGLDWLPGLVPQGVLRDVFQIRLARLGRGTAARARVSAQVLAAQWRNRLASGEVKNRAELARLCGVSRARVTQVLRGI